MKKITCWVYDGQYKALTRLPDYSWGISMLVRRAIDEFIKNHSAELKPLATPESQTATQTSDMSNTAT